MICATATAGLAQCPPVNVYPFVTGCPLPASSLNAAIAAALASPAPPSAPLLGGNGSTYVPVAIGSGLSLSSGVLRATSVIPPSAPLLGGNGSTYVPVTVGSGLSLNSGVLAATGMSPDASNATLPAARTNLGLGTSDAVTFNRLSLGGTQGSTTTQVQQLAAFGSFTGTVTSGGSFFNEIAINNDTVDSSIPGGSTAFFVGENMNSAFIKGGRTTLGSFLNITSATGNGAGNHNYYVALGPGAQASANDGGTNVTGAGNLFGFNPAARLLSGATYWQSVVGGEVDVRAEAGTTKVYSKEGFKVVQESTDAVSGTVQDFGYGLINQSGSPAPPGWAVGFTFGSPDGYWPMQSTGTMIGTLPGAGGSPTYAAAHGIDFSSVTFSTDAFKSTGFSVSPTGKVFGTGLGSLTGGGFGGQITFGTSNGDVITGSPGGSTLDINQGNYTTLGVNGGTTINWEINKNTKGTLTASDVTWTVPIAASGNLVYGSINPRIYGHGNSSGTTSGAGVKGTYIFNTDADTVDASSAGGLYNAYFGSSFGGGTMKGNRDGIFAFTNLTATSGNTGGGTFYTAVGGESRASANDNGTAPAPRGSFFGSNFIARLTGSATFANSVIGQELDVAAEAGSSVAYKAGQTIVQFSTDSAKGSVDDVAFAMANQNSGTAPGWDFGISFGLHSGWWPITSTGTLIGTIPGFAGSPAYAAAHGIDFSSITFSADAFKSTGFSVSPTGKVFGAGVVSQIGGTNGGQLTFGTSQADVFTGSAGGATLDLNTAGYTTLGVNAGATINWKISGATKGSLTAAALTSAVPIINTGITTDATHTDTTVCQDTTTHEYLFGSGAAGICLGTSSLRFKTDVHPLKPGLAQITALEPIDYRYKPGYGGEGVKYGFAAEQVAEVMPELVGLDKEGRPNSVDWAGVVPVLVKAIQEQQAEIAALKAHR